VSQFHLLDANQRPVLHTLKMKKGSAGALPQERNNKHRLTLNTEDCFPLSPPPASSPRRHRIVISCGLISGPAKLCRVPSKL
jgi:hypothetical protein